MKTVQRAFLYLMSIAAIAAGAAVAAFPFNDQAAELAHRVSSNWMFCLLIGCAAAALGLVTLLPFGAFARKGRSISFAGPTGTVTIQIDPFAVSLRKTIAKLPMVKRVSVCVTPKDNGRKVGIEAAVTLKKPAESSTRETAERLREFIDKVSRQILGADEIMTVDVRVEDVLVDPTQTAESLNGIFAAAEKNVAPAARTVALAGAAAAAPDDIYDGPDGPIEERAEDTPEVEAETHSSDLLTYDEAEELRHARVPVPDGADQPNAEDDDGPKLTSFEDLSEGGEDGEKADGKA